MKRTALIACFFAIVAHAQPSEDASVTAERARLAAAREKVESEFRTEEKACYAKFAVNECLAKARSKRREAVGDLRRQEIALNDAERKRKAAERRHAIDEKNNAQRERDEAAPQKAASDAERALRANERNAARAAQSASASQKAVEHEKDVARHEAEMKAAQQRRVQEAAKNAREHRDRVIQAREHEEKQRKRTAERSKPPASSLADPK